MKTYRLKKEYPGHCIGDILYKKDDCYQWDVQPFIKISSEIVEGFPEFFEEFVIDWKKGDIIYFLSVSGEIIDEFFDPSRHSTIIYWGNAFRSIEEAKWYQTQIAKLTEGGGNIVINKNDILPIFLALQDSDVEKAKSLIKKFL
jgi:hypothetical protein